MRLFRRAVGATILLLATVGFVACLVGLAGIWMLQQTVYEKVEKVTSRLDAGLQRAAMLTKMFSARWSKPAPVSTW